MVNTINHVFLTFTVYIDRSKLYVGGIACFYRTCTSTWRTCRHPAQLHQWSSTASLNNQADVPTNLGISLCST